MNNPVRAASQRWIETPLLIGKDGALAGQRVLEVGCGRGVGLEILLSLGATHVTGVDLDPRMVALAQKRVARYGRRARALVGDAEALDAPDGSFDGAWWRTPGSRWMSGAFCWWTSKCVLPKSGSWCSVCGEEPPPCGCRGTALA